ncbi:MAG: FAD-dependent oxidoreductase [Nocardioidaceae bacterium]|nr:FAD-dependent oxidoreductase [Nocardioidaceae bacterium]
MPPGFVIVGGGLAAARAAETLRDEGHDGALTVLAAEPRLPYDRPPLSKEVLKGDDEPDSTVLHDEAWYAERDIEVRLGVEATGLDTAAHRVTTADGESLDYDKVLLATGSRVLQLPVPGSDLDGVVTLRTLEDSVALRDRFADRPHVVVVGAGWIGMEAAAAARAHGCEVSVVSPAAPLIRALGDRMSRVFARAHRDNGVDLVLHAGVQSLRGKDRVEALVTTDGRVFEADLVVVGVGVQPNAELAAAAGLSLAEGLGGAVVVDSALRTSDPDVVAAGDVCAWPCRPLADRRVHVEHWANAHDAGPVAARTMLGKQASHDVLPFFWSDQFDIGMEYVGHTVDPATADLVTRGDVETREFMAFWLVDGRIEAGMHSNVWDTVDHVQDLIRGGREVDTARLADPDVPLTDL